MENSGDIRCSGSVSSAHPCREMSPELERFMAILRRRPECRLQQPVRRSSESGRVRRVQSVLQLGSGVGVMQIADALSVARSKICRWAAVFMAFGDAAVAVFAKGRRHGVHSTAADASWINRGEGPFGIICRRAIKRGRSETQGNLSAESSSSPLNRTPSSLSDTGWWLRSAARCCRWVKYLRES